jgi:4-hydroxy-tetrahydrodipicolinate reductase
MLPIEALRLPDVPGTHTVDYRSEIDTISISHEANNRAGFAIGAILSAEFILGKKGIFTIQDVLNIQLD